MASRRGSTLPIVSKWRPAKHPAESLEQSFFRRCRQLEHEILHRIEYEKSFNQFAFHSGPAVEEILRGALRELLPARYGVLAGSVSDSRGYTAGDCDIVVFNDHWFPKVKTGPTSDSRRVFLPIEGVYAALEVKQTLTPKTLDQALEKLVTCHRLFRPPVPYDRVVENDGTPGCVHFISNPLFSGIIAGGLGGGLKLDNIVERFIRINQALPRSDVVQALCVLGHGTITWAYQPDSSTDPTRPENLAPALFMTEDRFAPLIPIYGNTDSPDSPLYGLVQRLLAHVTASVLAPENVAVHYGWGSAVRVPESPDGWLAPDETLSRSLHDSCVGKDTSPDHSYHRSTSTSRQV